MSWNKYTGGMNIMIGFFFLTLRTIGLTYAVINERTWRHIGSLSGKLFEQPMFDVTARGRVHCSTLCSKEFCCWTMTFNPNTKGCRGYCRTTTVGEQIATDVGRELYQREPGSPVDYNCFASLELGLCLSLKLQTVNKYEAADRCEKENGHLVRADTVARIGAVTGLIRNYFTAVVGVVWVDGEDFSGTNNYIMTNGGSIPITHELWNPDEPNSLDVEQCIGLYMSGKLNDYSCSTKYIYFVCEY
ncbi:uncharacterized protein [Argopecten irradians]|uniref:uncharacterized protein n=1 Tax=Argopecten irradians TaxID=31199 RepID=UPI00371D28F9